MSIIEEDNTESDNILEFSDANRVELKIGNCLNVINSLPEKHYHSCITSPPYFGLRSYYPSAVQINPKLVKREKANILKQLKHQNILPTDDVNFQFNKSVIPENFQSFFVPAEIGLEQDPQDFVQNLVELFRGIRRVLRDDGTLWINIGDSYSGSGKGPAGNLGATHNERHMENIHSKIVPDGTKPKDLIGIPWMLAFALRNDGWYLRQDIIWSKPNPMPESVADRCTKSHEYLFLLSKKSHYYFDHEAIKENGHDGLRNKRSVWNVPVKPFKGAHFATFPEDLIQPCVLAGCPKDGYIIDPFGGSGTTGLVAAKNSRNATLIELNPEYGEIAKKRLGGCLKKA
jgi:site-specific DNA-methyltransferase (adenine-specific)